MIKLSEEDMLKAKIGWKLGLLCWTVSQVLNENQKFLKENKVLFQWTHERLRKQKSLIADLDTVLVAWIDQTNHNTTLSQSLI